MLVRRHSSNLSPSLSPCLSSGNLSEGSSRRLSKVYRAKSTAKQLGQLSGSACAGWTGESKHRVFPSQRQSLLAATASLEENMLPHLRYWLNSRANKVFMLCKYLAATSHFFFHVKWNFNGIQENLLSTKAVPIASLSLSIIHWSLR